MAVYLAKGADDSTQRDLGKLSNVPSYPNGFSSIDIGMLVDKSLPVVGNVNAFHGAQLEFVPYQSSRSAWRGFYPLWLV